MKLKGIELKGTYKVIFYDDYFEVYNKENKQIYFEDSNGYWAKSEYNKKGKQTYFENSNETWYKMKYDERNNQTYYEDSNGCWVKNEYNEKNKQTYHENNSGYWAKREFDESGNLIYFEDSEGDVFDKRVRELTIEEIENLLGFRIKIKEEKENEAERN